MAVDISPEIKFLQLLTEYYKLIMEKVPWPRLSIIKVIANSVYANPAIDNVDKKNLSIVQQPKFYFFVASELCQNVVFLTNIYNNHPKRDRKVVTTAGSLLAFTDSHWNLRHSGSFLTRSASLSHCRFKLGKARLTCLSKFFQSISCKKSHPLSLPDSIIKKR